MYLSRSKPETMATGYHKPKQGTSSKMLGEGILSHPIPNLQVCLIDKHASLPFVKLLRLT